MVIPFLFLIRLLKARNASLLPTHIKKLTKTPHSEYQITMKVVATETRWILLVWISQKVRGNGL